jgi:hypothetical protein
LDDAGFRLVNNELMMHCIIEGRVKERGGLRSFIWVFGWYKTAKQGNALASYELCAILILTTLPFFCMLSCTRCPQERRTLDQISTQEGVTVLMSRVNGPALATPAY